MPKVMPIENNSYNYEKGNNNEFKEFLEDENKNFPPKYQQNEAKQEYDFKDNEVEDVEKLTNSKLICNIGYGGFSTVKLIFNYQQRSYYAMKVVNLKNKKFKKKTPSKNREFIHQEILVNFNARNNNIVKLYGYFNHKEYILLILEYMNNRDLKHFMKKFHHKNGDSNFSELLTGYFILQILRAMGYLKMRNILHRDIKPENIMLNSSYIAKLGDFSLSRKIDFNSTFKTSRSGTLPYLSPECVKKKVSIKSTQCEKLDLFSLGVVMYFLLFNRHPYGYKNHMTVTEYSKALDNAPLTFEGNKITDCCKNLVQGLLEKNVNKRFCFDHVMNHPWVHFIRDKVEEITSKFQNDPEKMISQLNNTPITDDYFNQQHYIEIDVEKEDEIFRREKREHLLKNPNPKQDMLNKKRERSKKENGDSLNLPKKNN